MATSVCTHCMMQHKLMKRKPWYAKGNLNVSQAAAGLPSVQGALTTQITGHTNAVPPVSIHVHGK